MSAQQTAAEQLVYMFMNYWGGELKRSGQRVDAKALEAFREQGRELVAEVERAAAEKAYERGRLDERHDCDRRGEYERGEITLKQLQADLRPLYPYRRNERENE